MRGRWIFVGTALVAVLIAFYLFRKYRVAPDIKFRELPLTDMNGDRVSLAEFAGKPLVLSFAASWCGPCISELSSLREASASVLPAANVIIVSDEDQERIARLQETGNFPFRFARLGGTFAAYGIHSIPTTYLINADGKVVKEKVGFIDWSDPSARAHLIALMSK